MWGGERCSTATDAVPRSGRWPIAACGRQTPAATSYRRGSSPAASASSIRVDDRGAHYPLTIDPFFQAAKLRASDPNQDDALGASVAVSGDTIAAGAPGDDSGRGSVYVFTRGPNGWFDGNQTAKLTAIANDRMTGDHLGQTVAISGDTIVAGAPDKNLGHPEEGAVYVFVRPPGGWTSVTTTARLSASDRAQDDHLGFSVAISGNTIAAGAPGSADPSGAAYVFVKPPTGWTDNEDTAKLTVGASALRFLGQSVAVSGDTVVVGAPIDGNRGAAYVYVRPGGGWVDGVETAKLTAQTGRLNDELGYAVAMDGNTIAVAARRRDIVASNPNDDQGAVDVYVKPAGAWVSATENARLTATDAAASDQLGESVAVSGDTIVAGVPGHDVGGALSAGAVYAFMRPAGGWSGDLKQTAQLLAGDGVTFDQLGSASGAGGATVVGATDRAVGNQGALYVFENDSSAPAAPVLSTTDPGSPANANTVRVRGTAEPASTVRLYGGDCTGSPLATGPAADLAGAGVAVSLADNSVTTLRATATDRAGNTSACSAPLTYVEDSAPPGPPALAGTAPGSPGNATAVRVTGTAEPGSIVRVYSGAGCAGPAAAEGPAAGLAGGARRRRRAERGDNAPGHGH